MDYQNQSCSQKRFIFHKDQWDETKGRKIKVFFPRTFNNLTGLCQNKMDCCSGREKEVRGKGRNKFLSKMALQPQRMTHIKRTKTTIVGDMWGLVMWRGAHIHCYGKGTLILC